MPAIRFDGDNYKRVSFELQPLLSLERQYYNTPTVNAKRKELNMKREKTRKIFFFFFFLYASCFIALLCSFVRSFTHSLGLYVHQYMCVCTLCWVHICTSTYNEFSDNFLLDTLPFENMHTDTDTETVTRMHTKIGLLLPPWVSLHSLRAHVCLCVGVGVGVRLTHSPIHRASEWAYECECVCV